MMFSFDWFDIKKMQVKTVPVTGLSPQYY